MDRVVRAGHRLFPLPDWSVAFESQAVLAKVHNTGAFLQALYLLVRENDPVFADRILPPLREAIGRVP